jgi:hypothetical protein
VKDKTKRVTIDDTQYQLKRFAPDVGSFILSRILSAGTRALIETMKALGDVQPPTSALGEPVPEPQVEDHEARIRQMATSAFGVMSFDERSMIQRRCLEACSRLEGEDTPMPLANSSGTIIDDLQLVMCLELEVLVFNFQDFFAGGGLNALLKTPAPRI